MKRTRPTTLPIGSISHGTLQSIDIGENLWDRLNLLPLPRKSRNKCKQLGTRLVNAREACSNEYEEILEILESLEALANAHCPAYCYYGCTEGDGSDFGIWPDVASIEYDMENNDLPILGDMPIGYSGHAVEIGDHGNMTMYSVVRGKYRILWEIV